MKKQLFLFSILIILSSNIAWAQTGLNFGFKAGYNIGTQYGIKPADLSYEIDSESRNGFAGGIFLHFPITDAFSVQQEFLYSQKGSSQSVAMTQPISKNTITDNKPNYFELPILFRYNFANIKNVGLYGNSGFALSMLLNGDYNLAGNNNMGGQNIPLSESGNTDGLDTFDYSFIYGLGLDFKLMEQNCFFGYRQTIGWNTLQMPTGEGGEPAPLRNQTYSLLLGVYF